MPTENSKPGNPVRVRAAPSPTGKPHIGTAYNALFNYVFARQNGGKFILRIEDTDRERFVPGAEAEILEMLAWLGLTPDESPVSGGPFGPYRQSERLEIYKKYALELVEKGAAYYCFCSKERLEELRKNADETKTPPMYDGCCREIGSEEVKAHLSAGEPFVIRLKLPRGGTVKFRDLIRGEIAVETRYLDDQVLLKSDGYPTYHLANVVDDHLMGITHIIRGEEWLSSVPKHVILYQAFGWEVPIYTHTPLLRGQNKAKLGKRHGALPVLDYREQGFLPEALRNYLALLGWSHPEEREFFELSEMLAKFSLEGINPTAPVFDAEKLLWLNGKWLRSLDASELAKRIVDYLKAFTAKRLPRRQVLEILPLVQERLRTLADFRDLADYFFAAPELDRDALLQVGLPAAAVREMLAAAGTLIAEAGLDRGKLEAAFRKAAEEKGWKMADLCMAVRLAVTGKTASPPLFESFPILGKDEVITRLTKAAAHF